MINNTVEMLAILESMRGSVGTNESKLNSIIEYVRYTMQDRIIVSYRSSMLDKVGLLEPITTEQENEIVTDMILGADESFMWDSINAHLDGWGKLTVDSVMAKVCEESDRLLDEVIIDGDDRTNLCSAYNYFGKYTWIYAHAEMKHEDILKHLGTIYNVFSKYGVDTSGVEAYQSFISKFNTNSK